MHDRRQISDQEKNNDLHYLGIVPSAMRDPWLAFFSVLLPLYIADNINFVTGKPFRAVLITKIRHIDFANMLRWLVNHGLQIYIQQTEI